MALGARTPQPAALEGGWSSQVDAAIHLPIPGPVLGSYPLREPESAPRAFWLAWWSARWRAPRRPSGRACRAWLADLALDRQRWSKLEDQPQAHAQAVQRLRARMLAEGFTPAVSARALALVGRVIERHRGWHLHDGQWLAAWWMLDRRLVEMATGEGKSAAVVLAAAAAALGGVPVHVLTANDYLARRDAEHWMPVYAELGLAVSWVDAGSSTEMRQQAYGGPVVYTTAREVVFDHLRDREARRVGRPEAVVLRGLCMALIDEADSILIDEACTPLILSRQAASVEVHQTHRVALFLARQLQAEVHFQGGHGRPLVLLSAGQAELARLGHRLPGPWSVRRFREDQVQLALTALHGLQKDVDYLLRDGEVHLIDGPTGRLAVGRVWSRGLHQMVCLKEQLRPGERTETLMQTTYQAFFPRYFWLAGLSGTVREEGRELLATYGLDRMTAPLRQVSQRHRSPTLCLPDNASKWRCVAEQAREVAAGGRAVLVGVATVAECDAASRVFESLGIAHQVLHARHDGLADDHERRLVDAAGQPGRITLATHMAGRGTDVGLHPEVVQAGGLHVMAAHLNDSARTDRQLVGRSARQGQRGSARRLLSRDDLQASEAGWLLRTVWLRAWERLGGVPPWWVDLACRWHQWVVGVRARRARWSMLQGHRALQEQLSLGGKDDWV